MSLSEVLVCILQHAEIGRNNHQEDPPHFTRQIYKFISGETEANRKPNENPYWHDFLRSVVDFDSKIKEKFNGRKSFSISIYGSLKYLTNQGGFYIITCKFVYENRLNVGNAYKKNPEK